MTLIGDLKMDNANSRVVALFEALREDILKDRIAINDFGVSHITDAISKAEKKLEGVGYTVHWHEYFGIDSEKSRTLAGGCDFETDALTELEQEPLVFTFSILHFSTTLIYDSFNMASHTKYSTRHSGPIWQLTLPPKLLVGNSDFYTTPECQTSSPGLFS